MLWLHLAAILAKYGQAVIVHTKWSSGRYKIPRIPVDVLDQQHHRVEWQDVYGTEGIDRRQDHMEESAVIS